MDDERRQFTSPDLAHRDTTCTPQANKLKGTSGDLVHLNPRGVLARGIQLVEYWNHWDLVCAIEKICGTQSAAIAVEMLLFAADHLKAGGGTMHIFPATACDKPKESLYYWSTLSGWLSKVDPGHCACPRKVTLTDGGSDTENHVVCPMKKFHGLCRYSPAATPCSWSGLLVISSDGLPKSLVLCVAIDCLVVFYCVKKNTVFCCF